MKRFVLFELKTHSLTHQDVGQSDMYVRMYDDLVKGEDDNPTIGVLLCTETDNTIAKYSVLHESEQLFAAKYMSFMPTEEELRREIEKTKTFLFSSAWRGRRKPVKCHTAKRSIRHLFIVAYRPLSCYIRNAISNFFRNISQKSLADMKIKS